MSEIKKFKNYGLIGSVGLFLGTIPYIGSIIMLVSFILLLISFYNLSTITKDKRIFKYILISYIGGIIISILIISIIFGVFFGFIFIPSSTNNISNIQQITNLSQILVPFSIGAVIFWLLTIFFVYLKRKALILTAEYTKMNLFKIVGNLDLWGIITMPILIGFILIIISAIFQAISFYELDENELEKILISLKETQ